MNDASISNCGRYRYRLSRQIDAGSLNILYIGINPSTADATNDDATVRKWIGFSRRLKAKRFNVANVFSFRSTDVRKLADVSDPFGPMHMMYQDLLISNADLIVPCWGSKTKIPVPLMYAITDITSKLRRYCFEHGVPLMCFGHTKSGDPKHPLMLSYGTPLVNL